MWMWITENGNKKWFLASAWYFETDFSVMKILVDTTANSKKNSARYFKIMNYKQEENTTSLATSEMVVVYSLFMPS